LSRDEIIGLRKKLMTIINEAVSQSIRISQKSLKNIITEFSAKRGRGEWERK